jgi:hypothetical protein
MAYFDSREANAALDGGVVSDVMIAWRMLGVCFCGFWDCRKKSASSGPK